MAIAFFSGYSLLHSWDSIPKLQKYEKKAEKGAEWSRTAEKQLWDTRYTVAAGLIMVSFLLSDLETPPEADTQMLTISVEY